MTGDDYTFMDCEPWRDAISAAADGEPIGVESRMLDGHLARCADCRAFRDAIAFSRVNAGISVGVPPPDLARRVTKLAALTDRAARWSIARVLLAVVAVEIIVLSMPALILGDENTATHSARHLGAFTVAYGAGLLVVVLRPARARAMLAVSMVLAGALVITAAIDLVSGRIPLSGEAQHLPELISVLLIWLMTVPSPSPLRHLRGRSGVDLSEVHLVEPKREAG